MKKLIQYGPPKWFVRLSVKLSWPLMVAAKRLSDIPPFRWIINPFFRYPQNELTAVPIDVRLNPPDSVALPFQVVTALLERTPDIFILDECICRQKEGCANHPVDIGCIALGKATRRMHPSHGRFVTADEAIRHVARAGESGLVASIAHVWIDPVAFHTVPFDRLMFICLCDDCCCLYRTHMTRRGPNLNKAYKKLPGVSISVDTELCTGCGICADICFAAEMRIEDGVALVGDDCKGCARCVTACPEGAISLVTDDLDTMVTRLLERVDRVADLG